VKKSSNLSRKEVIGPEGSPKEGEFASDVKGKEEVI